MRWIIVGGGPMDGLAGVGCGEVTGWGGGGGETDSGTADEEVEIPWAELLETPVSRLEPPSEEVDVGAESPFSLKNWM